MPKIKAEVHLKGDVGGCMSRGLVRRTLILLRWDKEQSGIRNHAEEVEGHFLSDSHTSLSCPGILRQPRRGLVSYNFGLVTLRTVSLRKDPS